MSSSAPRFSRLFSSTREFSVFVLSHDFLTRTKYHVQLKAPAFGDLKRDTVVRPGQSVCLRCTQIESATNHYEARVSGPLLAEGKLHQYQVSSARSQKIRLGLRQILLAI